MNMPLQPFARLTLTHRFICMTPNGDKSQAYGLAVPHDWLMSSAIENEEFGIGRPMLLGVFAEQEVAGSPLLTVTCTILPEVPLEDWIHCSHAAAGWRLIGLHRLGDEDRTRYACFAVRDREGLHRLRMLFVDSGRLWCVSAATEIDRWPTLAPALQASVKSFALLYPTYDERLEARAIWSTKRYTFEVPSSWWTASSRTPDGDTDGHAYLVERRRVFAMLRARFRKRTERDRAALERKLYDELHFSPLSPRGPIVRMTGTREDSEDSPHWDAGLTCEADLAGSPVSVHVAVRRLDDVDIELRVITPREQDHPMAWMRGRRALEIAAQTAVSCS